MPAITHEKINVSHLVDQLCDAFGLAKENVSQITLSPDKAVVDVFLTRADGRKYIDKALNTAARGQLIYEIKT